MLREVLFGLLAAAGLSVTAQTQTGTLTLACEGTATDKTDLREAAKPVPVSMGLMWQRAVALQFLDIALD